MPGKISMKKVTNHFLSDDAIPMLFHAFENEVCPMLFENDLSIFKYHYEAGTLYVYLIQNDALRYSISMIDLETFQNKIKYIVSYTDYLIPAPTKH